MARTSGIVPIRLDAAVTATRRVRSLNCASTSPNVQLGGRGVEVHPADDGAGVGRRDHPRSDVGVVIEARHDDFVAGAPLRRQRPGQIEGERGHAPPEDHLVRVGVEQVGKSSTALHHDLFGVARSDGGVAAVRQRSKQRAADGVGDGSGRLGSARSVEVRRAVVESGEARADRVDVERRCAGGMVVCAGHERTSPIEKGCAGNGPA